MSYLDDVARKREEADKKKQREAELRQSIDATKSGSNEVVGEVARQSEKNRSSTQRVEVSNEDLARKGDIDAVIAQLKEVQLASLLSGQNKPSVILSDSTDLGEKVATLGDDLKNILEAIKSDNKNELSDTLTSQYKQLADSFKSAIISQSKDISRGMDSVNATLRSKDFSPNIKLDAPEQPEINIDLSSVEASLKSLENAIKANKVDIPKTDYSKLETAVSRVEAAINGLQFPVPNYVLPYRDVNGKATQVQLDATGKIPVAATTTIDTTGLATDSNQTSGAQKTQIVDAGGEAATVTGGKLDVNASIDTTGLATSAKQDTLLAELQLKADLTETQPVSLASVPSHAVTNAGTFAVQASGTKTNNNAAPSTDNVGVLPALVNASSPSFTEGNLTLLSINTTGNLRTTTNQLGGNAINTGNGTVGTGTQRVTIASDSTGSIGVGSLPAWGTVSSANSTTSNLAGGAAFTGTSENVSGYSAIQVSVFSSHASATDGLSLQQSSNGTNWDIADTYTIPATTGKVFSIQPAANFFRLVYTNGATLTTSLRIQTVYHVIAPNPSSQRTSDAYTNETDLTQQWVFNSLYNGTTWDRMRGDTTNGLDVDVTRLPALVAGSAIVGKVGIDQTTPGTTNAVVDTPVTSGGLSIVTGSVGATATAIKASAGQLYGYHLFNTTAAVAYVQIFNTAAASVTLGTTAPVISIGIPASGGVTVNFDKGIAFSTAISFGCTTTRTGSSGATCDVNFFYK